MLNKFPNIGK